MHPGSLKEPAIMIAGQERLPSASRITKSTTEPAKPHMSLSSSATLGKGLAHEEQALHPVDQKSRAPLLQLPPPDATKIEIRTAVIIHEGARIDAETPAIGRGSALNGPRPIAHSHTDPKKRPHGRAPESRDSNALPWRPHPEPQSCLSAQGTSSSFSATP